MNTLFSKKLLAIVISGLFLGGTLSGEVYALQVNTIEPVTANPKKHKHEHSESEENHVEEGHQENEGNHSEKDTEHDEHGHDQESKNKETEEEHEEGITLSPQKMSLANIKVQSIRPDYQFSTIYAPGEVKVDGYSSYVVSPRTESVIISRHTALGEHVEKGQKLVTLFSEAMAQAQADYLIASTEWQRVKKLGNKTVSESRLLQAQTTFNATYGKLIALGLTEKAIKDISNKDITSFGQYSLVAQREGVVLQDDFTQGQRVDAGDTIMLLADENKLWVEAKVSPNKKLNLSINSPAIVKLEGEDYKAKVIQEAHTIDPITRTRIIRLSVNNADDNLHSGMFVKVYFQFATEQKVMAVPEEALIRSADGDWTVFVEDHPGEFKAKEVELGRALGNFREIFGLESGTRVVTQGAFFVASEIAKGGFDPHNH
ncbi:RND transporter MFP subunit [Thalassotalea loyana]|jgi:RND family efflux transporter MFP subunit|uniref:Efflux transporter periplasmic adaptor subunit n=2 Tax=Alteromonadales TaxID=135622 RepID=A0A5R9Q0I5_9GAMM|nr:MULTISPECIES: efflux RND transporter periplasmic adaptor subunit [Alteromonadales]NKC17698.1 efflux RND transporter periplasmic adaptor subunit [Pseudoalteromonas galatheae]TLX46334.1 efflux transporter periplasmic adaptor subunit [Pseudoalteromonas phenolica]GLX84038.1 RND transporter MFP subunit [Thalassotalea loyana]